MLRFTGSEREFIKEAEWLSGQPAEARLPLSSANEAHVLRPGHEGQQRCAAGPPRLGYSFPLNTAHDIPKFRLYKSNKAPAFALVSQGSGQ